MKRLIRASEDPVIFEDEMFTFKEKSGVGINNTPYTGLAVASKGLAEKHVVDIRLNRKGWQEFNGEPVHYKYTGAEVAHGMRSRADTLEETREYIDVLEDALDFAIRVNNWILDNPEWSK